ncbi:MAG TPA: hypothetical protein VE890_00985, partial [Thermoguttaceae bacterium]|nr:hypothetical protein [Thermoguttaceae bacterium]
MNLMHKLMYGTIALLLTATTALSAEINDNGMRKLDPLPPVGVHPRVYFTADELPKIKQRLMDSDFGRVMYPVVVNTRKSMTPSLEAFAALDLSDPSVEQIEEYFKSDEGRNIRWGMVALDAVLRDDVEQKQLMIGVITNYA